MAMTLTTSVPEYQGLAVGPFKVRMVDASFAASDYPTAGYSLTAASVGLSDINAVAVVGVVNTSAKTVAPTFQYNNSLNTLQAFGAAGGATGLTELANNADVSAQVVRLLIFGT
jgi:hypothetical protein